MEYNIKNAQETKNDLRDIVVIVSDKSLVDVSDGLIKQNDEAYSRLAE